MSIKISETARKAAIGEMHEHSIQRKHFVGYYTQLAINEACKPLVEALEELYKLMEHWDASLQKQPQWTTAHDALAAHRKEHGP